MKTTLITFVLLALATSAYAQPGTGMLAPWNASAHPINAGGGAEVAHLVAAELVVDAAARVAGLVAGARAAHLVNAIGR